MPIETTVVGSYPKPPPEGRPFVLRRTRHELERGEATPDDVRRAEDDLVREVIAEQEAAGIDVVSDGQIRWDDLLTPFATHMSGFEVGALLRWFDNNVYYRRPVCTGRVEWRGPASVDAFRFAQSVASKPVKAVIPGPVTFAALSVDEHYGSHERFVLALARVLAQEAFELEAAGARRIQVDEPALLHAPEDLELASEAIGLLVDDLKAAEVTLATYFADAKRLGADLFTLPVHVIGLDFVAGPENRSLLVDLPAEKKLQAGVVDARNTKADPVAEVAGIVSRIAEEVGPDRMRVCPSAGLEFLPREKARNKLQILSEAVEKVGA